MPTNVMALERILIGVTHAQDLEADKVLRLDRSRLRATARIVEHIGQDVAGSLRLQLRRTPSASLLELVTALAAHPHTVRSEWRRLDPTHEGADVGHPDYRQTWFGRHVGTWTAAAPPPERVVMALRELCRLFSDDHDLVAFAAGAPSARAVRDIVAPAVAPVVTLTGTVGISAAHDASVLKHNLNDLLIKAAGLSGRLIALELGQGVGDGSLRYRRHGLVVAIESDLEVHSVAAGQVPHVDIPLRAGTTKEADPLTLPPRELRRRYGEDEHPPVLMFAQPTTAGAALRRLLDAGWRFNWIDIDPTGFPEANGMDVAACFSVAEGETLVCVTNGGWQAERYGTPRTMADMLTEGCRVAPGARRERQRTALVEHVLVTEAACRVLRAADMGLALHPVLLYDGRHHPGGVVRSYYLLSGAGNPERCRQYVAYNADAHLMMIAGQLIASVGNMEGLAPPPAHVPLLRFQDFSGSGGKLAPEQSAWLHDVLKQRLEAARGHTRNTASRSGLRQ